MRKIKIKTFVMIMLVCLLITGFCQVAYADIGGGGLIPFGGFIIIAIVGFAILAIWLISFILIKLLKKKNNDNK